MNPSPAPRRQRILIADDSPAIRECLSKLLEQADYEVQQAANGQEALEQLAEARFDLMLLDLNMPELDGWGTLERIRLQHPALPVVVITAQPNQQDWMQRLGAVALLEKPLDLPLLFQTLSELKHRSPHGHRRPLRYVRPWRNPALSAQPVRTSPINE